MSGAAPVPDRPIAILGATSQIARDFVLAGSRRGVAFRLYARRPEAVKSFLALHGLPEIWAAGTLEDFGATRDPTAGVVNCVGVGDPAAALAMGAAIFDATLSSDRLAIDHIDRHPGVPYLFLSSGAVYGTDFQAPATKQSRASVSVNALHHSEYYSVAKLHAEAVHRAHGGPIIDVRIFNYFSRTLDLDTRFFITDMIRCVRRSEVFETVDTPMSRDYLHPEDFCTLALLALAPGAGNRAVDARSLAPITKRALLTLMETEFGLRYQFVDAVTTINATGAKPEYYSINTEVEAIGYRPTRSSATGLIEEISALRISPDW